MSFFKKLFGGGGDAASASQDPPEVYKDFRITPAPQKEAGGYRICALIEKDIDGETKAHKMLRADTISDVTEARSFSLRKAKQVIDEQGDRIFG